MATDVLLSPADLLLFPHSATHRMSSEKKQIAELVNFADRCILQQRGEPLSFVEKSLLEQALAGKKLRQMIIGQYAPRTIEADLAPKLWRLLSMAIGAKVGIKNVKFLLEKSLLEQNQQAEEVSIPPASPMAVSAVATPAVIHSPLVSPAAVPPAAVPPAAVPPAAVNSTLVNPAATALTSSGCELIENLPAPTCTHFIGRDLEIQRLLELLSPQHAAHLITVDGIGGVGKTSLVVECARRCLTASRQGHPHLPQFEILLFVSAKLSHLESFGLIQRLDPSRSLRDILQQIATHLDLDLTGLGLKEQVSLLKKACQRSTLLIVDNLETVENPQEVIGFLYDLPASVKVILTTREQILFVPVRLTAMTEADSMALIAYEAQEKQVQLTATEHQALYQATGGVPVAVRFAIGQLANGYRMQTVLQGITQAGGEVARFCFDTSIQPLRGQPAHLILMALALLPTPVQPEALIQVAVPDIHPEKAHNALAQLRGLSLVHQTADRSSMLPLTREYALAELRTQPEFAQQVRQRWLHWYLQFTAAYAQQDAIAWKAQFDGLQEEWQNIRAIAEDCMAATQYEAMLQLWRNVEPYTYARGRDQARKSIWEDRLRWTHWLISEATQQSDWLAATEVMLNRAWTLIATRKPQLLPEAEQLLQQVWDLKHYQTLQFQMDFTQKMAVLRIEQHQPEAAQAWLDHTEALLSQISIAPDLQQRSWIQIQYYRGMSHFKAAEIDSAKQCFAAARQQAKAIGWERAVRFSENWLADIAILAGELEQAEQWLSEGLRTAERYQDLSQIAFVKRSIAGLYQAKGDWQQSKQWATEALEIFTSLDMVHRAEETAAFLHSF